MLLFRRPIVIRGQFVSVCVVSNKSLKSKGPPYTKTKALLRVVAKEFKDQNFHRIVQSCN